MVAFSFHPSSNHSSIYSCASFLVLNSLVLYPALKELFEIKDEGKEILGIIDSAVLLFDNEDFSYRKQEISNNLGLKDCEKYFNAGIVLFYMKNITNLEEYSNRLCSAFNNENLPWQDQDILNLIFANSTKLISWTWNFQYHLLFLHKGCIRTTNAELLQDFSNSINNPKIIHFTSNKKPWHYPDLPFAKDFWQYARKSPYYEEILQSMTEKQLISSAQETMLYINCQSI